MRSYTLKFDGGDEARERFNLLYTGFINGGNQGQKTTDVLRREGKILDKLEAVSELVEGRACSECGQQVSGKQYPLEGEQEIVLDVPEMNMLKKHVEGAPWTTRSSRKAVDLIDWLASIEAEECRTTQT